MLRVTLHARHLDALIDAYYVLLLLRVDYIQLNPIHHTLLFHLTWLYSVDKRKWLAAAARTDTISIATPLTASLVAMLGLL